MLHKILHYYKLCFVCFLVAPAGILTGCSGNKKIVNEPIWSEEWSRLNDSLKQYSSDLEKTNFLRKYCAELFDVGIMDSRSLSFYRNISFNSMQPDLMYAIARTDSIPADCGIVSYFYIKLAESFGFACYQYSFGFTDSPYQQYIHSFPVVRIQYGGVKRMIIQDPYLDLTFKDSKGDPIDFYNFLRLIKNKKYSEVIADTSSSLTKLVIADTALYLSQLNDSCRALFRKRIYTGDGFARKITFIRSYDNMMRSPCGNFESGFIQALRAHHIYEPFLYAYTLRVNEMAGSSDVKNIQSGIDSVLFHAVVN